ncbi:hypothetical protein BI347_20890 [Chromobacterium sphagni]|uniref:GpE family phage tail protein n=1 Tax=Chromobacterium sphagni TaxID=1903179 RepID=A0A1S1WU65_9NEIS|nr:hypothetical protein BI347_20890 [Chromobacterium sphagni]
MARCWQTDFARWWASEKSLGELDAFLLTVLQIQPSEIDGLDMEDYWRWMGEAERELKRRQARLQQAFS